MIVMAGPGQFGIQTLTLDGSDVYVGGQFIWTDSHEYYACNLGRYSTTGKSWEPLGKFVGGFREITSVVFDIYNHCRQLFFCGLFNIELTNGNIAKWVAMYDIETNTWNGVGPGGLGYHDANLLSPFAVSADARYVYIGGESISGQSAAYYWDRTDLNAKWEPLLSSTLVAFEGTVHDIELIPLSPTLENNTNKSFDDHNKNNNYNNNNNNDNNINNKNNDNKNDNNNDNDNDNDNNEYYYYDDAFSDDDDGDSNNNNIYNNVCNVDFGLFACDGSFCPPSAVLVGGNFESLTYRNFARCEIEREHFICLSLGSSDPDNTVRVVLSKNNFTAIGGAFAKVGQLFAPGVAVWDGFEWSDLPGLQNFQGSVMSLSIQQSVLEKRDLWDLRFNLVVFIPIVLIIIFVASLFVYRRRFDQGSGRKYYQYLEIPDDGSRPEVSLAAILESKISVIPSDDLVLGRRLGHGVAGEVFTAKLNKKGSTVPVAVKMLHFYHTSLENGKFLEDFLFEIVMTSGLSHPNVVTFLGVTVDRVTNDVGLVTELMTRGSLADILEDKTKITLDQKIQFSIDISDGLEYLHSIDPPIIHRDLKPANVLVASDWTCKISDLGISTFKRQHEQTMTTVGTPIFMAPEIIALRKYTEIADCYSFAVLLCDVYGEIPPFSEETFQSYSSPAQLLFAVAQDGLRPTIPSENCPVIIQNIISECFSDDPSCRPSAKEISQRLRRASCCPLDPFPRYSPYMETSSVISSEIEIPSSASSSLSSSFSSSFSGTPSSLPSSFSASSSFSQTWASSLSHLFASTKGEKKSPD